MSNIKYAYLSMVSKESSARNCDNLAWVPAITSSSVRSSTMALASEASKRLIAKSMSR